MLLRHMSSVSTRCQPVETFHVGFHVSMLTCRRLSAAVADVRLCGISHEVYSQKPSCVPDTVLNMKLTR